LQLNHELKIDKTEKDRQLMIGRTFFRESIVYCDFLSPGSKENSGYNSKGWHEKGVQKV